MGRLQAEEMAEYATLEQGITWHLRSNHYPPIPMEMVPVAIKAIQACNEDNADLLIETPFPHRTYGNSVPAWVIGESLHLEPWLK
jgi:hypothetical protein